jgi:uncharacterized protein YjiS (DUF1127 family)
MMEESMHGEASLCLLGHRHDQRRSAACRPETIWDRSAMSLAHAAQDGSPLLRVSPRVPLAGWSPRPAAPRRIAPLTALRWIVAAIRQWRGRVGSRPQLRELDDHLLKDIGLRREEVGYEFPKPFWRWD